VALMEDCLASAGFMPHGYCLLWKPSLVLLHVISDSLIGIAYVSIPFALVYFVRKRRDLPFDWMFVCFGIFILACGLTHFMAAWVIWHPDYWLSGAIKAVTAIASVPTAILLVRLIPKGLALPSPEALRLEIAERKRAYESVAAHEARLEKELAEARELQQSLLPREPDFRGIEVAALNRAAIAVSGDFYDFLLMQPNLLRIFIGDVSGKGAAAAFYAALASGVLRNLAADQMSPSTVLGRVNESLSARSVTGRYLTGVLVDWHAYESCLVLANAGAPNPILFHDGRAERLQTEGFPVGLIPAVQYEDTRFPVKAGDFLVLASDGILECCDASGREYGYERLAEAVEGKAWLAAAELIEQISQSVRDYAGDDALQDDQTVLVMKVLEPPKGKATQDFGVVACALEEPAPLSSFQPDGGDDCRRAQLVLP
jgi:serine phosphatase RsbU (regulator of sigma subunit)